MANPIPFTLANPTPVHHRSPYRLFGPELFGSGESAIRYRLLGFEKEWQDGGNREEVPYNNLGPGGYTFQVIACNNDGV